jgi:anti-anti-sigma factor
MALVTRSINSVDVITLSGRLDAAIAPELRDELKAFIDSGHSRIVIDLRGVSFVDSSGLSVLVMALKWTHAQGGRAALLHVSPTMRSLLELTRLQRLFEVFEDEAQAVRRLGAREPAVEKVT